MDTKICTKCLTEKSVEHFSFRNKCKGTRSPHCKVCSQKAIRKHYNANRDKYLAKAIERNKVVRRNLFAKLMGYLDGKKCTDCPEDDPVVFQFDHVRGRKIMAVSTMIGNMWSWEKIEKEIAKCEIRCANCHARKTAKQFGYRKVSS